MERTRTGGRARSLQALGGALSLATGILAGSVAGAGVVWAAVRGAGDGVIYACANPQSGRIQLAAGPDAASRTNSRCRGRVTRAARAWPDRRGRPGWRGWPAPAWSGGGSTSSPAVASATRCAPG